MDKTPPFLVEKWETFRFPRKYDKVKNWTLRNKDLSMIKNMLAGRKLVPYVDYKFHIAPEYKIDVDAILIDFRSSEEGLICLMSWGGSDYMRSEK